MSPRIIVHLPSNRERVGVLWLEDSRGRIAAGPFAALGSAWQPRAQSEGNPKRSPLLPFGDTPTGTYAVGDRVATGTLRHPAYSFGPHGALRLVPRDGDATLAAANGRSGLMIHGGAPGTGGRLRATHGCIRLRNEDMLALLNEITLLAAIEAPPASCAVVERPVVEVPDGTERDADTAPGADEDDPPPEPNAPPLP